MKILVVLAVPRRVRAPSVPAGQPADVGRRVVGRDLRPPPVRIHRADSLVRHRHLHGNRLARDPGLHVVQPGAPRRNLPAARPVHDGEAVHAAPRGDRRRHSGARGRERLRADERAAPAAALLANGASGIAFRDHAFTTRRSTSTPARTRSGISRRRIRQEFRKHVENGRQVYYRNCVFCHGDNMAGNGMFVHGLDPIPTNFPDGHDPAASRDVPVLADLQGRPRASRGRRALGHGHARVGEVPEGRRDLGRDPLPLRLHRPEASRQGGGRAK